MKLRIPPAAVVLPLVTLLLACPGEEQPPPPGPFGPFECVDRTATASPPSQEPPKLVVEEGGSEKELEGPVFTEPLCPDGQVPRGRAAAPNVAKGNPLIGPFDATAEAFFDSPEETSKQIREALRSDEEVHPFTFEGGEHEGLPDPPGCNGIANFGSCFYYGSASYRRDADGGGMTMTVERPAYDGSGGPGHSLDEIAIQGGAGDGDIVELGWNVSTSQYTDANPHLFVFHWIGWAPTCYDTCGWKQYSPTYFPGMDLSQLVGREVYIGYVQYQGNWWAWFDNQWLGYIEGAAWGGAYTRNRLTQWFGEVATANGIPPNTDMGNGAFPAAAGAARNRTLCDVNATDWVCWIRDRQRWGATFPAYYDIDRTGFGATRYGGDGD